MAGHEHEFVWPVYFAKRALDAKRLTLRAGDQFPMQDKQFIRGLGAAYGVADADRVPFSALDYVAVLDVRCKDNEEAIRDRGLPLKAARSLLKHEQAHG